MQGRESAETLALRALGWMASRREILDGFLAAGGLDAGELHSRAQEPEMLGAVLDFLLTRDDWVMDFAADSALPPDRILMARAALPGGDEMHWT